MSYVCSSRTCGAACAPRQRGLSPRTVVPCRELRLLVLTFIANVYPVTRRISRRLVFVETFCGEALSKVQTLWSEFVFLCVSVGLLCQCVCFDRVRAYACACAQHPTQHTPGAIAERYLGWENAAYSWIEHRRVPTRVHGGDNRLFFLPNKPCVCSSSALLHCLFGNNSRNQKTAPPHIGAGTPWARSSFPSLKLTDVGSVDGPPSPARAHDARLLFIGDSIFLPQREEGRLRAALSSSFCGVELA